MSASPFSNLTVSDRLDQSKVIKVCSFLSSSTKTPLRNSIAQRTFSKFTRCQEACQKSNVHLTFTKICCFDFERVELFLFLISARHSVFVCRRTCHMNVTMSWTRCFQSDFNNSLIMSKDLSLSSAGASFTSLSHKAEEKLSSANSLKLEGNGFFKNKNIKEAIRHYHRQADYFILLNTITDLQQNFL